MTQLCLVLPLRPLARRKDPATSHRAAARAERFAGGHHRLILTALAQGPATFKELAARTGLEMHAVARRLPELRDCVPPRVRATGEERNGCTVWECISRLELVP